MKTRPYYEQASNFCIATEILSDPAATTRETVLAQRIRGKAMAKGKNDTNQTREHTFD